MCWLNHDNVGMLTTDTHKEEGGIQTWLWALLLNSVTSHNFKLVGGTKGRKKGCKKGGKTISKQKNERQHCNNVWGRGTWAEGGALPFSRSSSRLATASFVSKIEQFRHVRSFELFFSSASTAFPRSRFAHLRHLTIHPTSKPTMSGVVQSGQRVGDLMHPIPSLIPTSIRMNIALLRYETPCPTLKLAYCRVCLAHCHRSVRCLVGP